MTLTNKTYDFLKQVVSIWMPALATLTLAIGNIWGLPYAEAVAGTITALATCLGTIMNKSSKTFWEDHAVEPTPMPDKRVWKPRTTREGLDYDGDQQYNYWSYPHNKGGLYSICLANCTTFAYGRILEAGDPAPVTVFANANNWPLYPNEAEGWKVSPFTQKLHKVAAGDLFVWKDMNHVAVVEKVISDRSWAISESMYTGDDGTVNSNRSPAVMGNSLKEVSDWMIENYPSRFFNYRTIDLDGGDAWPDYVLYNPNSHKEES